MGLGSLNQEAQCPRAGHVVWEMVGLGCSWLLVLIQIFCSHRPPTQNAVQGQHGWWGSEPGLSPRLTLNISLSLESLISRQGRLDSQVNTPRRCTIRCNFTVIAIPRLEHSAPSSVGQTRTRDKPV